MMKRIAISLIIIMVFCGSAFGANLNLTATWTLNTEPDIKEYRLYRTDGTRTLLGTTPHPNKSSPFTVTVPDGSSGTLLFVVTAVDTSNYESADSNQASYSYNLSATTVTINATDNTATEAGTTTGTFTVSRTGSTSGALTVYYSVSGTATPGSDYNSLSGSVTIASGSSTGTITVTPINDTAVESDETVIVTLSANAAYTVGSPSSATVTITSDDVAPSKVDVAPSTVTIAATDNTATENPLTTGYFTVSRTGSTSGALTVYYSVSGTATPGSDYNSLSGSVTIASGSSTGTITVTPINDTAVESNETVIVTLSSNAAYTVGSPSSATVTITSDDSAYSAPQGWVFTISNGDTGGATLWFVDGTFEGYGVSFNFETFRMIQGTYNVDAQGLLSGIFTINNLEGVVGPVSGNLIGRVNSDATKMTLVLEDSSKLPVFNMTGLRLLNEPEILGNWGVTISGDATGSFDPLIINSFQDGGEVFSHVFGISGSGIIGSGSVSIQGNFFFTPTIKNKGQENIIYGVYEMTGGINEKGVISGTLNSTKGKFTFNLTSDNGNKYRLVGQ